MKLPLWGSNMGIPIHMLLRDHLSVFCMYKCNIFTVMPKLYYYYYYYYYYYKHHRHYFFPKWPKWIILRYFSFFHFQVHHVFVAVNFYLKSRNEKVFSQFDFSILRNILTFCKNCEQNKSILSDGVFALSPKSR